MNPTDGMIARCVHRESFIKLNLLKYYLDIFDKAINKNDKFRNKYFIDLFAGPGLCFNKDTEEFGKGSSLLSLDIKFLFTDYIFVDLDIETTKTLEKRCAIQCPSLIDRVRHLNLNSNESIDEITNYINFNNSIALVFIDPNGLDIHFSTIKKLSQCRGIDLIINFGILDLKRNEANYMKGNEKANLFFGCEDWPEDHFKWLPFYKERLRTLGFKAIEDDSDITTVIKGRTNAPIYYLIYASKHNLGLRFWRQAKKYVLKPFDLFNEK